MPDAGTDPMRAWKSGNRWFLTQCSLGTGKLRCPSSEQAEGLGVSNKKHSRRRQSHGMADLTNLARAAVPVMGRCGLEGLVRRMPSAVRHCLGGLCNRSFMRKMACIAGFMCVTSYHFCSDLLLHYRQGLASHFCRHGVPQPAAQGQQHDHEGEH